MTTELFHRPPRRSGPPQPQGEIALDAPPELPDTVGAGGAGQLLTYLPMLAGAASTALLVSGSGGSSITYVASGMMALSMVGMALGTAGRSSGEKRRRIDGNRVDYLRHLAHARHRVRSAADQQRACAIWRHPDPDTLWAVAAGTRLWERRRGDEDFLAVRVARGPAPLSTRLIAPEISSAREPEPGSALALRRFVHTHRTVGDVPVALNLADVGRVIVRGPDDARRSLARAVISQLAGFHAPDDVVVAACTAGPAAEQWGWLKWLPHALSPSACDAAGPVRLIGADLLHVEDLLDGALSGRPRFGAQGAAVPGPHVVIVVDGGRVRDGAQLLDTLVQGVTVVDLSGTTGADSGDGVAVLTVEDRAVTLRRRDALQDVELPLGRADALSVVEAEVIARRMSPMRIPPAIAGSADVPAADRTLTDLLGLGDPHLLDPRESWRPRAASELLRVPIGVGADGQPVELDIKESAQGGMGPHGLVVGATGSGKSELLRTLVLGLALTHSPELLNLVLVDFKGGATFASLDALPHTSAIITNLQDELVLVDRMRDALQGELVRRQEALRAAGNYASRADYERAREQGAALEPMASLFVVVDEFSELLAAKPDFIDLFVTIGRLGRSLGVHLLLASQRLEEGRLRGLDTHLSYRIGLRTFSAAESRTVLGVADAYDLPGKPGHGYLKDAAGRPRRFTAAYVSAPASTREPAGAAPPPVGRAVLPYGTGFQAPRDDPARHPAHVSDAERGPAQTERGPAQTVLDLLVGRLRGAGPHARRVWLPPLAEPPTLDHLLPPLHDTSDGLLPDGTPPSTVRPSILTVPVGVVDRPFEQRRDLHRLELASSHAVIVGRPQSGKSTALRTIVAALALTHTPEQVQFYCLDFGGGTLCALGDLPHVGSVATRLDADRLRRTIAEVEGLLTRREQLFTERRIDSMATYRRLLAAGEVASDGYGDLFLVVDGWGAVRADHEELEAAITRIATRGLGFGVHVVLTVQRWPELRPALRDVIGTRLELRLGDPSESDVDRRVAATVPEASPGRGLTPQALHVLAALPRIDGAATVHDLSEGVAELVNRVRRAWSGPVAPPVRLLPHRLPFAQLPAIDRSTQALPIGIDEDALAPVSIDLAADPHVVVIGDVASGKSNLLRAVARGITSRWTPDQAKVITFDYRRGLLGAITTAHQLGYVTNSAAAPDVLDGVLAALRERLAGITVDPAARQMPTWRGPKLFLLIDDYDLVAGGAVNPLQALTEFLPQALDIGLHVVLARASGGAGRAMFEPALRSLRDMGTPCLLLSGSRDEGAIASSMRMEPLPPGRGRLVRRREGAVMIQTALAPSDDDRTP